MNEQQQVKEWMQLAGQDTPDKPTIPPPGVRELRVNLIQEDLLELDIALNDRDLVETADALADLLYVVLGTAVACGIDLGPVFAEVHRSNLSKFIDGHRREDGKWCKGPSYSPANLRPIIERQMKGEQ
jgi:predicted HAD superfamily Cof-like phosphohydrolase